MIDLVLTMIAAYDDYETELGFTKDDINNIIKKYKALDDLKESNEIGWIILWKNKYISNEIFAKLMDVEYEDKDFWIVCDNFDDVLSKEYETEIEILDGNLDWEPGETYDVELYYHWNSFTEETLKDIVKFCIDKGFEIDDELMTEENTIFKDGDIYFIGSDDEKRIYDLLNDDELEDLKSSLNIAICEAQESADQSEMYRAVKKAFINSVGEYKYKTINVDGKDEEKLYIRMDIDWVDIESRLKDEYGDFDFDTENYGSLLYILKEYEYFDFRVPDYDRLSGSIDDDIMNEYIQNRLEWD